MSSPVPFRDRSRQMQLVLAVVVPAVIGALAGVLLGVTVAGYWIVGLLAAIGAIVAGFEHSDWREGALRGLARGAVYGTALLIVHQLTGADAKVSLGDFPPLLVVITALIGMLVTALGARLSGRRRARSAREG